MGKHASVPRTSIPRVKEKTSSQKLSSDLLTRVMACTLWVLDTGPATARTPCTKSLEASIYLPLGKMLPLSVLCGIHTSWASTFCLFFKSAFTMHDCGLWCGFESTPRPTFLKLCEININNKFHSGRAETSLSLKSGGFLTVLSLLFPPKNPLGTGVPLFSELVIHPTGHPGQGEPSRRGWQQLEQGGTELKVHHLVI